MGAGRSAYPQVYSVNKPKKDGRKQSVGKQTQPKKASNPSVSTSTLGPAIDGPPSPERIRAYTESMRRGSALGGNSKSDTFTSTTPSYRSRESVSAGNDSLSRKSSNKSTSSGGTMPSAKSDRPESVQIFGSIFSRSGRKARKESNANSIPTSTETPIPEESSKEVPHSSGSLAKRHHISTPYNFQHLTHTQQDEISTIENGSRLQLETQFSAIRASQVPSKGELKGIRAQDLHFENFSSESLPSLEAINDAPPPLTPKSPRRQASVRKNSAASTKLSTSRSQDNLRAAPPTRPPRSPARDYSPTSPISPAESYFPASPQSTICPVEPPTRTSSRTASILFDTFDPLATTTLERPQTHSGFRRPTPFSPPVPPPAPSWSETESYFASRPLSHAVTTPGDEAWPLSTSGTFGGELEDVQEEDENVLRMSKGSVSSNELRSSMSVPALRLKLLDGDAPQRIANQSEMGFAESDLNTSPKTVLPPTFHGLRDSWEDDVDFCYENELEADDDYDWDRDSMPGVNNASSGPASPQLHLHLDKEVRTNYQGRFRPTLTVPTSAATPELSPMSDNSAPVSEPQTPATHMRPISNASSFKESHGFHLSPSLLVPGDFRHQMNQENVYEDLAQNATSSAIFSAVDESIYSNSSYHSSAFSRQSARSSSSTRISTVHSRGSQDSGIMMSRTASLSKAHRSVSSDSSLPEMIPSALRNDLSSDSLASMNVTVPPRSVDDESAADPPPPIPTHRRTKSSATDVSNRKLVKSSSATGDLDVKGLSPVAETFVEVPEIPKDKVEKSAIHGRKTSVPLAGIDNAKFKARARASTASAVGSKPRGGYALFPTIV